MINKKFLNRIAENWPAKALSIAIALMLFVFYRMNTLSSRPISVPLIIQTEAGFVPASHYPKSVRITLRGEYDGIISIAESDITAYADFSKFNTKGWHRAQVQIRKEGSALGVEPLEISVRPLEISILLDINDSKTVPLTFELTGRMSSGFDLTDHSLSPKEVVVSGPLDILETVTHLKLEPIDMQGRNGDFSVIANIINDNPFVNVMGNGTAEFKGVIRQAIQMRNIEGIPIVLTGLAPSLEADTGGRTGSVRLGGNQSRLDIFIPRQGFLSIDCSGLSEPGVYPLPVIVNLPDGFTLVRHEPEELIITVVEKIGSGTPPAEIINQTEEQIEEYTENQTEREHE